MRYKMFSTQGMDEPPAYHTYFRIGPWTGTCVVRTKWFVVMDQRKMSLTWSEPIARTPQVIVQDYISKVVLANPNDVIQDDLSELYDDIVRGAVLRHDQQELLRSIS
jgi:hypothetical protein